MAPRKKPTNALAEALQSRMQSAAPTQPEGKEMPAEESEVPARRRPSARSSKPGSKMPHQDLEDKPARTINTRASNKNAHPGQIIRNNTQKRRSSAEVQAANNAKKADRLMKNLLEDQAHHDALEKIAEEEERLFLEDLARRCVAERPDMDSSKPAAKASKPQKFTGGVVDVSDGEEEAAMSEGPSLPDIDAPEFTGWDEVEAVVDPIVDVSDTDSRDEEYQPAAKEQSEDEDMEVPQKRTGKLTATKNKVTAHTTGGKKERGIVGVSVNAQRERLREAMSVGTKRKAQGASTGGSITDQESGKRAKTTGLGGLRKDWQAPNQKPEQRLNSALTTLNARAQLEHEDESSTNLNNGDDDVENHGEWDDDEPTDMVKAVRNSKGTSRGPSSQTTRNMSQHGMKLSIASAPTRGRASDSQTANSQTKPSARSNMSHVPSALSPPFRVTQDYQPESTSDVTAINTPATAERSVHSKEKVTFRDLPFPKGHWSAYAKKWKVVRASLINWSGTLPDMFSASSHPEFLPTLKQLWIEMFPELAHAAEDRSLIIVAGATIRDHRSAMGKAAVTVVASVIPKTATTPEKVIRALKDQYCTVPEFIYRRPYAETGNRGSYLSDVILEVLAVHMGVVLQAEKSFGRPAGALALVCAAVERALDGWKGGVNAIEEAKKDAKLNKGLGFKADRWGPVAACWLKGIDKNMTEKRWDILIRDTAIFIPDRLSNDFDFEPFAEGDIRNIDGSGDEFLE
ncbi:hypothetical protein CCMSSC00406_0008479 [Pleurotus cornucopiae]|uniref:Uncharacterized protein n=1 Tax=Pleurotus cornucopiae TaxID=5321 RepID=A0ACB7IGS6_PLECO|nr:hypothetical protein CCMSSC00406_0008479 [Pleurotus cornucopiae]